MRRVAPLTRGTGKEEAPTEEPWLKSEEEAEYAHETVTDVQRREGLEGRTMAMVEVVVSGRQSVALPHGTTKGPRLASVLVCQVALLPARWTRLAWDHSYFAARQTASA